MNARKLALQAGLILTLLTGNVSAVTDEQLGAIEEMGKWYGIALPCKYLQETRRIKQALVAALPKQRYMGQLFEQATNKSFLEFVAAGTACPEESELAKNVDAGIDSLNRAFQPR